MYDHRFYTSSVLGELYNQCPFHILPRPALSGLRQPPSSPHQPSSPHPSQPSPRLSSPYPRARRLSLRACCPGRGWSLLSGSARGQLPSEPPGRGQERTSRSLMCRSICATRLSVKVKRRKWKDVLGASARWGLLSPATSLCAPTCCVLSLPSAAILFAGKDSGTPLEESLVPRLRGIEDEDPLGGEWVFSALKLAVSIRFGESGEGRKTNEVREQVLGALPPPPSRDLPAYTPFPPPSAALPHPSTQA